MTANSSVMYADRFCIRDVSFCYDRSHPLIEQFALQAKPGMRIAIVGPTGCGKTTLINLLMRFYDVDSGTISIDGTPITSVSSHSLRSSFGMVLQETWLKSDTVRENIRFGRPDATDQEVIQAAKSSALLGFYPPSAQGIGYRPARGQRQSGTKAAVVYCPCHAVSAAHVNLG